MPYAPKKHRPTGSRTPAQSRTEYERKRSTDPALAQAKRIRSSGRWQKVRLIQLAREPLCEDCREAGCTTPAVEVDHVRGLREAPELAYTLDNLRSLCRSCHARKSAQERAQRG